MLPYNLQSSVIASRVQSFDQTLKTRGCVTRCSAVRVRYISAFRPFRRLLQQARLIDRRTLALQSWVRQAARFPRAIGRSLAGCKTAASRRGAPPSESNILDTWCGITLHAPRKNPPACTCVQLARASSTSTEGNAPWSRSHRAFQAPATCTTVESRSLGISKRFFFFFFFFLRVWTKFNCYWDLSRH